MLTQNAGTEVLPDFHWHRRIATINAKEELPTSQPDSGLLSLKVGAGMPAIEPRRGSEKVSLQPSSCPRENFVVGNSTACSESAVTPMTIKKCGGCTAQVEEAGPLCAFQAISTVADICPTGRGRTANDAESIDPSPRR